METTSGKRVMTEARKLEIKYYNELLKKCEMKRIGENLTKREVTDVMNVHYNFYWNCINGKNELSPNLASAIEAYLQMPTSKVYETIFALRPLAQKSKKVQRDESGKEIPEERLGIKAKDSRDYLYKLESEGVFQEPKERFAEYASQE